MTPKTKEAERKEKKVIKPQRLTLSDPSVTIAESSTGEDNGSGEHATWQNAIGRDHSGRHGPLYSSRRRSFPQEPPLFRSDAQPFLLLQQHRR